jgi:hypothetical protein
MPRPAPPLPTAPPQPSPFDAIGMPKPTTGGGPGWGGPPIAPKPRPTGEIVDTPMTGGPNPRKPGGS